MKRDSLISIIIPVYNSEKTLKTCIESVLRQSYTNIEVLAVDDGSNDSSLKMLNEYAKIDDRISVFHKENGGQSSARNLALRHIKGEFFCFVDSDDELAHDYVERLYVGIEENKADISICGIDHLRKGVKSSAYLYKPFFVSDRHQIISDFLRERYVFGPVSKLFRSEIFKEVKFTEGMIFEDIEYLSRIYLITKSIQNIEYSGYIVHENANSTVHSAFDKRKLDLLTATNKILSLYQDLGLEKELELFKLNSYLGVLLMAKDSRNSEFKPVLSSLKAWIRENMSRILSNRLIPLRKKIYALVFAFEIRPAITLLFKIRDK